MDPPSSTAAVRLMRDVRDCVVVCGTLVARCCRWLEGAHPPRTPKTRSAEHVAAALGDDVDDAAGHAAVFGGQTAGLHFDFLHEVEVERLALVAQLDAGRVEAVDDVLVFRARRIHTRSGQPCRR